MNFSKASAKKKLKPDKVLAEIVGTEPRPRSEILKDFWQYIKEQGLQDSDRRVVNAAHVTLRAQVRRRAGDARELLDDAERAPVVRRGVGGAVAHRFHLRRGERVDVRPLVGWREVQDCALADA